MTTKIKVHLERLQRTQAILPNVSFRTDCPECGHRNTLSITGTPTGFKYNCFSASCDVKGVVERGRTMDQVKEELKSIDSGIQIKRAPSFDPPEWWIPASGNSKTVKYLHNNNSLLAYRDKRADVRYDPKLDRHVFVSWQKNICVGAYGRGKEPKWYNYNSHNFHPYIVPQHGISGFPHYDMTRDKIGIVVEDCASACAASCVADGIALIGTNLAEEYTDTLSKYDYLFICLDADATKKSLEIAEILKWYVKRFSVVRLSRDLKEMNQRQIQSHFRKWMT